MSEGSGATASGFEMGDGRLDLNDVFRRLRAHWIAAVVVVAIALAGAITYLHLAVYKYTATLTVVPADQSNSSAGGGLAGLGSLVGINLSTAEGTPFVFYADAIKSQAVAERLARDHRIMRTIFSDEWDPATGRWVDRPSTAKTIKKTIKGLLGVPANPWSPPTAEELQMFLDEHVTIIEDKEKAKLTISFKHRDKRFAAHLLNMIYRETDEFLRANSLARTGAYAEYLERRLGQVTVAEYRQSLAETLAAYEKTRMMASSDVSFAAERFGAVWISPNPTDPSPFLVIFICVAVAIILWAVGVLLIPPLVAAARA